MRDWRMIDTRNLIKSEENRQIKCAMEELKNLPNNNTAMLEAVKKLNKLKPCQHLLSKGKTYLKANPQKQVEVITKLQTDFLQKY